MGVYIKNMEMPKSCHKCFIKQGSCPAIRKRIQVLPTNSDIWVPYNYRHDDCPLGNVSTPHGDLIDQGAAVQVAMEWCPDDDGSVGKIGDLRELLDEIEALPTIIEAEE